MKKIALTLLLGTVLMSGTAYAEDSRISSKMRKMVSSSFSEPECEMKENVQIYVNFQREKSVELTMASKKMDAYLEQIEALAEEAGVEELEIQSYNYSVNSTNSSSNSCGEESDIQYQFYGNVNYKIMPEEAAAAFMSLLSDNGFTANMNVNAYRQCQ